MILYDMIQYDTIQCDMEVQGTPSSDYNKVERTGGGQRVTKK